MKRWHEEINHLKKEWKKFKAHVVESNKNRSASRIGLDADDCECKLGKFRKKKNFDCGKPQCKVCHSDKFPKRERTKQEILSEIKMKENNE